MRAALAALWIAAAGCGAGRAPERPALFRDAAPEAGLVFTHVNGAAGQYFLPEIMGAGCALLDYDGDGDLDVFLVQGGPIGSPGKGPGNRLFRNDLIPGGKLRFEDVTAAAGLEWAGYGMGAATGDFDSDGRIDLLVTGFGGNVLYRNEGQGKFRDVTAQSPDVRMEGAWSTSASFFDYDRDGWLDLVILRYVDFSVQSNKRCTAPTGEADYCTPVAYRSVPARLFHNDRGRFRDVTAAAGLDRAAGPGLGVAAVDANGDGWPDLFVANDTAANHLWINGRNGTFREEALERGVAYGEDGLAKAGMGVAPGDYDQDGKEDLLVLNLMREGGTLFRNDGRGGFTDVSRASGLYALSYAFTGFGTGWIDFDNDGRLDLFLANGAVTRREEQRGQSRPYRERRLLLRNGGGGKFSDASGEAGPAFSLEEVSRGAAFGDVDNDGRVDILVTNNGGPVRLLLNQGPRRHWIGVALEGARLGIGWQVWAPRAGGGKFWKRVRTDSSYLSASDGRIHFGLGESGGTTAVVVEAPDGRRREYAVKIDQYNRITLP